MKDRVKAVYLSLGQILNNPGAFGFEERVPKELSDALSGMQRELFEELKEEMAEDELLAAELSQDTDHPAVTSLKNILFATDFSAPSIKAFPERLGSVKPEFVIESGKTVATVLKVAREKKADL